MKFRFLVCPFKKDLIDKLDGHSLVIVTDTFDDIFPIVETIKRAGAHLHCLKIHTKLHIENIPYNPKWEGIPLAVYSPALGRMKNLRKILHGLQKLNLRLYLPADNSETYQSVRILSSLGLATAIEFTNGVEDWELLSELISYTYFSLVPHAPIEPFNYIAFHYHKQTRTDFSAVYFDDPQQYIHVDQEGRVYLTSGHLKKKIKMVNNIHTMKDPEQQAEMNRHKHSWRNYFLETDGCAYCQGWRVCLGKFSLFQTKNNGCRPFFIEMMDSVEQYQASQKAKDKVVWQP